MQLALRPVPATGRARSRGRLGFAFSRRTFILLVAGLTWLGPMFWRSEFLYALVAWDVLLFVGWLLDLKRLPRPGEIEVSRVLLNVPALAEKGTVEIQINNHSQQWLGVDLVDDAPARLRTFLPELYLAAPARGRVTGSYSIEPMQRGDAIFGKIYLRYHSAFRLAERWAEASLAQRVRVYPNLEACKQQTIYLVKSRRIEQQKRLMRVRGLGREFESLREYQLGDELRDVCWTATARRGKLVTRLYQMERSQAVWLVLDSGRLMRARVGGLSKLDHGVNAALGLAQLALHSGDRVGMLAYARQVEHKVGLAQGAEQIRVLVNQLAQVPEHAAEGDHLRAAATLLKLQKRRSLVVWITDLAETALLPEVIEGALLLAHRHLVMLAVIGQPDLNQAVSQPPGDDAEGLYRYTAALETIQRRELMLAKVRERGAIAMEVEASNLSTAILNKYLEVKERGQL